jgi:D-glycero-alpha-D-manno-heptose-7-phosphate kinase
MREVAFDTAVRARAPLLIGLCGLHAAIARFAQATLRPLPEPTIRVRSLDLDGVADGGIVAACLRQVSGDAGARGHGLELDLATDAPLGSGLGAPSALAVVIIGAFATWDGLDLAPRAIADLAREIQPGPGAKLDPYAATSGGFNAVERDGEHGVAVHPVPVDPDVVHELELRSLLVLAEHPPAAPGQSLERSNVLAPEARTALVRGRLDALGGLLHEDWQRNPSTPQADELYGAARTAGALGGTACGTGAGGFVFLLCAPDRMAAVGATLRDLGAQVSPVEFTSAGLRSWLQDAGEAP